MKKIWIGISIIIIVALAIVLIVTQTKKEPEEITIGAILPLTGSAGYIGERIQKGIDLALDEVNNQDQTHLKLKVLYEDSNNDSKTGVSAFRKLITNKVNIVICAMSTVTKSIIPLANENQIPLISTAVSAEGIAASGDWIFRFFTRAEIDAEALAKYAYKTIKLRKVAIIHVQDDFGISYANVFRKYFGGSGGKVIHIESFDPGETNFLTPLTKIKSFEPDGIFIVSYANNLAIIPKQMKELGIKSTILGTGTIGQQVIIDQSGGALEGAYYTANEFNTYNPSTQEMRDFVEKYQKKYGTIPEYFEVFGYDITFLIAEATKSGITNSDIRNGLLSIKEMNGVTGKISVSPDREINFPIVIKRVNQGKPSPPLLRYDPINNK